MCPLTELRRRKEIPRSHEGACIPLHSVRQQCVRIFVSHRWLSPWWPGAPPDIGFPGEGGKRFAHPDAPGHPKCELVLKALERMVERGWLPGGLGSVVLWVDYACVDQDAANPANELNRRMAQIIGTCDIVLTPVVDTDGEPPGNELALSALNQQYREFKSRWLPVGVRSLRQRRAAAPPPLGACSDTRTASQQRHGEALPLPRPPMAGFLAAKSHP